MRKGLFGNYVITEEEKATYESYEKLVRDKDKTIKDRENVIRKQNTEINNLESLKEELETKITNLTNDIKSEYDLKLKDKDAQIEKLAKEKASFAARCGGYQKEQNKNHQQIDSLKTELDEAYERINNFSKQFKDSHVQISPKQYDKKITTVAQHKKKLKRGK